MPSNPIYSTERTVKKAGRELDALIAERVMGFSGVGYYAPSIAKGSHLEYVRVPTNEIALARYAELWPEESQPHDDTLRHWKEGWGPLFIPEYSTDIGFAWEVVEKMRENDWTVGIDNASLDWCAGFARIHWNGKVKDWVAEDSAPLAICLAALKAIGA